MNITVLMWKLLLVTGLGMLAGLERDHSWRTKEDLARAKQTAEDAMKKFSFIESAIPSHGLGGVRTYTLLALLGAMVGIGYRFGLPFLPYLVFAVVAIFILVSFALNYFDKNSFGLTTELSMLLNFLMSILLFATDVPAKVIIAIVVFETVILSMKSELRGFISKFSPSEIVGTLKFLLVSLVILPFLPNHTYSIVEIFSISSDSQLSSFSWLHINLFNPFTIWVVVAVISSLNFIGYFLTKSLGSKKGLGVTGLIGGLISSTAVTQAMASYSRKENFKKSIDSLVLATILANFTSFIRIFVIALVMNFALGLEIFASMMAMSGTLIAWVVWYMYFGSRQELNEENLKDVKLQFKSPFSIKPALQFAGLFMFVTSFTQIAIHSIGNSGFVVSSLISAFSGLDAITMNTAILAGTEVTIQVGALTLVAAAVVNLIVKMFFVSSFGGHEFKKKVNILFLVSSLVGILVGVISILL